MHPPLPAIQGYYPEKLVHPPPMPQNRPPLCVQFLEAIFWLLFYETQTNILILCDLLPTDHSVRQVLTYLPVGFSVVVFCCVPRVLIQTAKHSTE